MTAHLVLERVASAALFAFWPNSDGKRPDESDPTRTGLDDADSHKNEDCNNQSGSNQNRKRGGGFEFDVSKCFK